MTAIPSLFEHIPENLLVPLASPLKQSYWNALMVAYRMHQASELDEVPKDVLLDRVEEHFLDQQSSPQDTADDAFPPSEISDEHRTDLAGLRLFAWRVLKQLEHCGWFDYEYHSEFGLVLRIPHYANNLLAVLEETARGQRAPVKGLAYNVKQILADVEQQRSDPGFVLYQARDAIEAFFRELRSLRANIGRYVERAAEQVEVRELLSLQMDDFWPKVVEPSYHQFKTSDNVLRFRLEILDRLEELAHDPLFIQEAAARVESREDVESERAKALVHEWLDDMSSRIQALDELIEEIDSRHTHYAGLTLQRIRHRLTRNESTESRLVDLLGRLEAMPDSAEGVYDELFETYRLEVIGEDSLYRVPRAAEPQAREPVEAANFSGEDRDALLANVRQGLSNPVSRERIFHEIGEILEVQGTVELSDLPVGDDLEFLRLIALHAYRNDQSAPYELQILDDAPLVGSGVYRYRNGQLAPKQHTTIAE